jgi:hypothetical protein
VKYFGLYNEFSKTYLTLPSVGLWFTDDREEADDMLQAAHGYVRCLGMEFMIPQITVKEVDDATV